MTSIEKIHSILKGYEPELLPADNRKAAAVSLLLTVGSEGLNILFIERAACDGDPWSGNICFPGGKIEEGDGDARSAAERETLEEVGVDLRSAIYMGRLSDVDGSRLPVRVSCFIYWIEKAENFTLNEEVQDAFWVPLAALCDPSRHSEGAVVFGGETFLRPVIQLPQRDKPALWGLTYRLVMEFLRLLGGDCGRIASGFVSG
jgi:8-oxo-dGTP pyrophosphatase MutT (NUDIX family)